MISRRVLIGGGTGFIGRNLNKHLTQNGYDVSVISRMPGVKRITWHEVEHNGIPGGVSAVVNLTGQNVLDPTRRWTPGFKQNVWNSRINSCTALVRAIQKSKDVRVFVNISGVSHYKADGRENTEESPVEEFDFMSRLCVAWEKAATLPPELNRRCVKIRTGVVVGKGGGMIESMKLPFLLGLGGPMGDGSQTLPWIHIKDLCQLIQYSIENEKMNGVVNAVAPETCTNGEFCQAYATALRRPSIFGVPEMVVNLLFGKERASLLLSGAVVRPKKALQLGFVFGYPNAAVACAEVASNQ